MFRSFSRLSVFAFSISSFLPAAVVFTDQPTFQANVSAGSFVNTFTFVTNEEVVAPVSFSGNGFSYQISTGDGSSLYQSAFGEWIQSFGSNRSLVITFTSGNVRAVGANFIRTDATEATLFGGTVTINLSDGTVETITPGDVINFRGFTSNTPIASLTLAAGGSGIFNTLDDLIVGDVASVAVPEPPAAGLALIAGLMIVLGRYRRS